MFLSLLFLLSSLMHLHLFCSKFFSLKVFLSYVCIICLLSYIQLSKLAHVCLFLYSLYFYIILLIFSYMYLMVDALYPITSSSTMFDFFLVIIHWKTQNSKPKPLIYTLWVAWDLYHCIFPRRMRKLSSSLWWWPRAGYIV